MSRNDTVASVRMLKWNAWKKKRKPNANEGNKMNTLVGDSDDFSQRTNGTGRVSSCNAAPFLNRVKSH